MKGYAKKFHIIMSTNESADIQLGSSLIVRSNWEKILRVKIDYKLNFDKHVKTLSSKANNKLRALARATKKKKYRRTLFSTHSLTTAHLYGCDTALRIIISSEIFVSEVLG